MRYLCLFLLVSLNVSAGVVQPGDGPYYRVRSEQLGLDPAQPVQYVYDSAGRGVMAEIATYLATVRANYEQSFGWKLDEREDLILTSPRQQVTNGYATVSPNLKSVWFPSGAAAAEGMAATSWGLSLATHETAHLYQLNAKGPVNSRLKKFFGNTFAIFPFVWPVFIHPNALLPHFLLEGNAVLNESRAHRGGRLFSGEARALVLAQIQAGDIDATRLINNEFRFPFGQVAYLQGAYFQAHLAGKYGIDKTNQFFVAQGDHYLWPLILNSTFREHFGSSYPQEIREYVREMDSLAKQQVNSPGQPMIEVTFIGALNHDKDRIYFLSSDGKRLPILHEIDKATFRDTSRRLDLPFGKVFFEGDYPLVATSDQADLHHVVYSLYGEGDAFNPRYQGQVVFDQRAGKTASLDASNAWMEDHVLVDGEPYDVASSGPALDSAGNIYYFRQNGAERVLYKNRQPQFKFEGFYGKITEVDADGVVYFVACTDFGSSLFYFKNNEIRRLLVSDRVIDARHLSGNKFLALEISAKGHSAIVTDADPRPAVPALYAYGFASYHLAPAQVAPPGIQAEAERPYNSLRTLRYSGLDLSSRYDSANGLGMSTAATFTDPLEYQSLQIGFSGSQYGSQAFVGKYSFSKYLLTPFIVYDYSKEAWKQYNTATRLAYEQEGALGFSLPVLHWRHWDADAQVAGIYRRSDLRQDSSIPGLVWTGPRIEESYGSWSQFNLAFAESPIVGFFPWQSFVLNYQNRLESLAHQWRKKSNTSLAQFQYQHGLPLEFYASISGNVAWAENHDISVDYNPAPLSYDIRIPRLTARESFKVKTASAARFELSKVFNTPLYSARIPIGLERVAPLVLAQGIFLDPDGRGYGAYPANIFEWGAGADFQVLLLHIAAAKVRIIQAFDTRRPAHRGDTQAQLALHHEF